MKYHATKCIGSAVIGVMGILVMLAGGMRTSFAQQIPAGMAALTGYIAQQQEGGGIYTLSASAENGPLTATFFLTDTVNNERSSVVANCTSGTCVKNIDTHALTQGTYVITAQVVYPDGTNIKSNQIVVDIPVSAPPAVVPVDGYVPVARPTPVRPKQVPVVKKASVWGYILEKIRFQKNTPEQQTALAAPLVQEMRDISIGLQGGERDIADAVRRLGIIESEFWEGNDGADAQVQAKTQYQSAQEFGATIDAMVMKVTDVTIATTTRVVIASSTTTTAKGEQVIVNARKQVVTQKLRIGGKALPNMYVTAYVYGPVSAIGAAKAGPDGRWMVELGNAFVDGRYEAYAVIGEYTGKVIAKSARVGFMKQGESITVEQAATESMTVTTTEQAAPAHSGSRAMVLLGLVGVVGMGSIIGTVILIRRLIRRREDVELNP